MFHNQMTCNNGFPSSFLPPNFILQTPHHDDIDDPHHQPFNPLSPMLPTNPQEFRGLATNSSTMLGKRSRPVSVLVGMDACEEMMHIEDQELSDDGSQAGEKKRRLNVEQVRTLEKSFEMGNKLEPERKMQLAKALGLKPRQIAIWFQNRRARWKTKQLEKDFDQLKSQFEALKAENEMLLAHNNRLQAEIMTLKGREGSEPINLNNKEKESSCSNRSENSPDINLDISRATTAPPVNNIGSPSNINENRHFLGPNRSPNTTQFLPIPSKSETQCANIQSGIQEDNLCNMFSTMDDHPAFWTWSDHQSFH